MAIPADEFKILVETLERNSSRTRAIYYVFAIIYVSITLYAVSAFIFSIPQERMTRIRTFVTDCQLRHKQDAHCEELSAALGKEMDLSTETDPVKDFDLTGLKHRRDTYLDEIATGRKFTFPLFGVSVDEDYFWLMNSMIGVIIYFVLISALANEADLFCFMIDESGDDRTRLQIVLSTQVLSSPSDHRANTPRSYTLLKRILLRSVLLLPVAVGFLWILYSLHIIGIARECCSFQRLGVAWSRVVDDFSYLPVLSVVSELVQAAAIVIMLCGFHKILHILSDIQTHYTTGASKLYRIGVDPSELPAG
jgi:hypothetical protein